jgi:hypothetical protein
VPRLKQLKVNANLGRKRKPQRIVIAEISPEALRRFARSTLDRIVKENVLLKLTIVLA